MPALAWKWETISARQLVTARFEEISSRFRVDGPIALLTPVGRSEEVYVVNLLSPLGTVFWGSPHRDDFFADCASGRALGTLPGELTSEIKRDLKAAGVSGGSRALGWFFALGPLLSSRRLSLPPLSSGGDFGQFRHWSLAIQARDLGVLRNRLDCEAAQFLDLAFFKCDENVELSSNPIAGRSEGDARLLGLSQIEVAAESLSIRRSSVRRRLQQTVKKLEVGNSFDFDCSPRAVVCGVAALTVPSLSVLQDDDERMTLSLRARLVRLLGWPVHFAYIREIVSPDYYADLHSYDIRSPYDFMHELTEYLREMRMKFPILREAIGP